MNTTRRTEWMQRRSMVQNELIPQWGRELEDLTPRLIKLIHSLEWVCIEDHVPRWIGIGRPPKDRGALANAFVAKTVLGLSTSVALIERLTVDRGLRRICGFAGWKKLPNEATFSRAFAEFAHSRLAERMHERLIQTHLGDALIGHISRDGTAIQARERPARMEASATPAATSPKRRGRPRKGEASPAPKPTRIQRQRVQTLAQAMGELQRGCDRGSKCNAQGYKISWNGYKLHLDTADCGVPISAVLTSASVHDSQAAIPLSRITASRVTHLYDVMDAAYCSDVLREHCRDLGHIPLIDHNPRGGQKIEFDPAQKRRYNERTVAERTNARLKDEFGGNHLWVKGDVKVMSHLMFGVLVLAADQLMRLLQ